jgi:hypothetical protein
VRFVVAFIMVFPRLDTPLFSQGHHNSILGNIFPTQADTLEAKMSPPLLDGRRGLVF